MSEIRHLSIFGLIGPLCATAEDGRKVNDVVQAALNDGCSVKLDFHRVKLVTPSFYDAVIHDLNSVFPEDILKSRFAVINLPDSFPRSHR